MHRLWVLDEIQLMGAGLPTSTQLAALRPEFKVFGKCPSIWMSATLDPESLKSGPTLQELPNPCR